MPKASSSEFDISTEGQTILEDPYSLESRLKLLPSELRPLFFDFHHRLITEIGSGDPMPRTQKHGITYRTDRGAYIWANFYKKFISLMLFTGSKEFPGLKKTTWIKGGDQKGSLFHIREKEDISRAVEYGKQAYRIALREKGS